MLSKNQNLPNTAERGLPKVTAGSKCDSCNAYLGKGVCPHHQQKVKHSCQAFYMDFKNNDQTINTTLLLYITADSLFLCY